MTKAHLINVYREAAEMVDALDQYSCYAVRSVSGNVFDPVRKVSEGMLYSAIMLKYQRIYCLGGTGNPKTKSIRVLLLLFMAEWVRTDYQERA